MFSEPLYNLIFQIINAPTPMEALQIYVDNTSLLNNYCFIFFGEYGSPLPSFCIDNLSNTYSILSLPNKSHIFVLDEQRCHEMLINDTSTYSIGICLELDTQVVSYIEKAFSSEDGFKKYADLMSLILSKGFDYSCWPYMIENCTKMSDPTIYRHIYQSLLSFNYLKTLKNTELSTLSVPIKYPSALYVETDNLIYQMRAMAQREEMSTFLNLRKAIYCLLLKSIILNLSSRKSPDNKMRKLLDFVNLELGVYLERELAICYMYFDKRECTKKFFKRIQNGTRDILSSVTSMSWDLFHIRSLEFLTQNDVDQHQPFSLHSLVTYDLGLRDILSAYPISALVLHPQQIAPYCLQQTPLYDLIPNINFTEVFANQAEQRRKIAAMVDYDTLIPRLEQNLLEITQT